MDGWVKLHRKIKNNIFLMNDDRAYIVFTKLLVYCNSNGQWAGGRNQLAEMFNMNPNTLYKVLQRLDEQQLITISSNNRYTIYSICKWSTYQQFGNNPNTLSVTSQQQRGNSAVTSQQHSSKNKNKIKNKIKKPGFDKSKTLDKKVYAKAVKVDAELKTKEQQRKLNIENDGGYKKALSVAELIKKRRLSGGTV